MDFKERLENYLDAKYLTNEVMTDYELHNAEVLISREKSLYLSGMGRKQVEETLKLMAKDPDSHVMKQDIDKRIDEIQKRLIKEGFTGKELEAHTQLELLK